MCTACTLSGARGFIYSQASDINAENSLTLNNQDHFLIILKIQASTGYQFIYKYKKSNCVTGVFEVLSHGHSWCATFNSNFHPHWLCCLEKTWTLWRMQTACTINIHHAIMWWLCCIYPHRICLRRLHLTLLELGIKHRPPSFGLFGLRTVSIQPLAPVLTFDLEAFSTHSVGLEYNMCHEPAHLQLFKHRHTFTRAATTSVTNKVRPGGWSCTGKRFEWSDHSASQKTL